MQSFQIIKSPSGEEMVVIPKGEFDDMLARLADLGEDDDDVSIYDARKAEMATEGTLPAEVSMAILRGENRIKALRQSRNLKQQQLAEKAGLGQGFLSDLESGRRKVTDAVAESLSAALGTPASWFKG